jgi:hypothetical protein
MPALADEPQVKSKSDLLFVGEVLEVSTQINRGVEEVRAIFIVLELKKGPRTRFITVQVHHGGTSCDLVRATFKVGERYLVSGNELEWVSVSAKAADGVAANEKVYYNNYCDLRERLGVTPNNSLERTRGR